MSNWRFLSQSNDYFAADIDRSPFLHFWSLSIEEQFYFAFPLILLLLLKLRQRWRPALVTGVAVLAGLSVVAQFFWAGHDPNHAYYGTDARAYQLLVGVLGSDRLAQVPGPAYAVGSHRPLPWGAGGAWCRLGVPGDPAPDGQQPGAALGQLAGADRDRRLDRLDPRGDGPDGPVTGRRAVAPGDDLPRADLLRHVPVALAGGPGHRRAAGRPAVGVGSARHSRRHRARLGVVPAARDADPPLSPSRAVRRLHAGRRRHVFSAGRSHRRPSTAGPRPTAGAYARPGRSSPGPPRTATGWSRAASTGRSTGTNVAPARTSVRRRTRRRASPTGVAAA